MTFSAFANLLPVWGWMCVSMFFYTVAEIGSKQFANQPRVWLYLAVPLCYATGTALGWLPAMLRQNELAVLSTIWAIVAIATSVMIGGGLYAEEITLRQWLGLGLSILAVFLLAR